MNSFQVVYHSNNSQVRWAIHFKHGEAVYDCCWDWNSRIVSKLTAYILWWMFIWLSMNGKLNIILALGRFSQT